MSYGLQAPDLSLVGGGVSGAIVTVIVGMIMNAMNNDLPVQPTRAPCRKDFEPVRHVRYGSLADIRALKRDVRFTPEADVPSLGNNVC